MLHFFLNLYQSEVKKDEEKNFHEFAIFGCSNYNII